MTPLERYERAQAALHDARCRWDRARRYWERTGGDGTSYAAMVEPWAEGYERRSREARDAWCELQRPAVAA